ncbi:MAG: type I DNA topoisomerase [SAR202 cluster bacterium]|nr:type I DNA topoisomerase [SAR202 cluster bacterium]
MAKDLVIVESPAKAKTIGRFLGSKYVAKASMGHVRDIPRSTMGVAVDDLSFTPTYEVMAEKQKVVAELAKASKEAETVYLATDPDREGEAISWHLVKAAKIDEAKIKRVVFHEITAGAVKEAFDHPRAIDLNLVNAQQARRILDRLVGYELSPVLWRKVRRGLSAGRVQSVALRLVVDREREIMAFTAEEYWSIEAELTKRPKSSPEAIPFMAELRGLKGTDEKIKIGNQAEATRILADIEGAMYVVSAVTKRERKAKPAAPFITSTLQQEAYRKLRFGARKTMRIAQQLYEGVDLGPQGATALITYMRTDSTNLAESAVREAASYIRWKYGKEYMPDSPRVYAKKVKGAQEAHEAIRPISIGTEPEAVRQFLNRDQYRLYDLIWKRMLASQMSDAVFDSTRVDIDAATKSKKVYEFRATGSVLKFAGFRAVYMEDADDAAKSEDDATGTLPELSARDLLDMLGITPEQHFTQPPPRYTEATLIKALEEDGIGRPSTYAPTIATVVDRDYVRKDQGRYYPTKLGFAVTGLLTQHFPDIIEVGFTARVEEELDEIARGERQWKPVLKDFYKPFNKKVSEAMENAKRVPSSEIDEESSEVCDVCGRPMVIKSGRFGRFLSCSGFPDCKNSAPLLQRIGVDCPECGNGQMVERKKKGKDGKKFYGCSNYPTCTFTVNQRPLPQPCPDCGKLLVASGKTNARCTACAYKGPIPEDELVEMAS